MVSSVLGLAEKLWIWQFSLDCFGLPRMEIKTEEVGADGVTASTKPNALLPAKPPSHLIGSCR